MNTRVLPKIILALVFTGLAAMFVSSFNYRLNNPSLIKRLAESPSGSSTFGERGMSTGMTTEIMTHISELMGKLRDNPNDFEVRVELAEHFMEGKDWASASVHLKKALELRPDEISVLYNLGVLQYEQKLYADSAKNFEHLLEIDDDPSAWFNLAILYHQHLGRSEEARKIFTRIAALSEADPALRGRAQSILGTLK